MTTRPRSGAPLLLAALLLPACLSARPHGEAQRLVALDDDPGRLAAAFAQGADHAQLVAVVSPTCASCAAGLEALQDEVLPSAPADLTVHLVWAAILPSDTPAAVDAWRARLSDPRVHHYWDPDRVVAGAYRDVLRLGLVRTAWDVWICYGPGRSWEGAPPAPGGHQWAHQLPGVAAGNRRAGADALAAFLLETLARLDEQPAPVEAAPDTAGT